MRATRPPVQVETKPVPLNMSHAGPERGGAIGRDEQRAHGACGVDNESGEQGKCDENLIENREGKIAGTIIVRVSGERVNVKVRRERRPIEQVEPLQRAVGVTNGKRRGPNWATTLTEGASESVTNRKRRGPNPDRG